MNQSCGCLRSILQITSLNITNRYKKGVDLLTMKRKKRTVKCDCCGIKYTRWHVDHKDYGYPRILGVSYRCIERAWEVCPKCLDRIVEFMDGMKNDNENKKE